MEADEHLLERWRAGDAKAGNALFRRHFASIRRFFANKVGADHVEELVQHTFTGCIEGRERFAGRSSFRTFLFAIAKRQFYKHLRDNASRRSRHDPDMNVSSVRELGYSPSSIAAAREQQASLLAALQRIPVEQQLVLELFYWEQFSGPQIAEVLEVAPATVRTRLFRARAALKEAMDSSSPGDPDELESLAREVGEHAAAALED